MNAGSNKRQRNQNPEKVLSMDEKRSKRKARNLPDLEAQEAEPRTLLNQISSA